MSNNPLFRQPDISQAPRLTLRTKEVAKLLGVCDRTIRNWTEAGVLPAIRIGRATLYATADLQALIDKHKVQGAKCAANQEAGGNLQ